MDTFLNHQMDPVLMQAIGNEFAHVIRMLKLLKFLTIESSGIAPSMMAGLTLRSAC